MNPENITILTVDDTPANTRLLTHYLEKQGYNVISAEDGFEGFKAAIQYLPDLILLDVMMPGTDGYEVCELLKAEEETRHIPVIFLTAKAEVEDKIKGFEMGAVDYIIKPFNLIEIATRVNTHLKLQYLEDQNEIFKNIFFTLQNESSLSALSEKVFNYNQEHLEALHKKLKEFQKCDKLSDKLRQSLIFSIEMILRMKTITGQWLNFSELISPENDSYPLGEAINDIVSIVSSDIPDYVSININDTEEQIIMRSEILPLYQSLSSLLYNLANSFEDDAVIDISMSLDENATDGENKNDDDSSTGYVKISMTCDVLWNKGEKISRDLDFFTVTELNKRIGIYLSAAETVLQKIGGKTDFFIKNDNVFSAVFLIPVKK